ncbi:MAG: hypothetical protein LBL09_05170 [Oscillospiraceae bacterium]|jgi:hypothetical protein|nr:hypothetical protein [Oscillospiraceae bacterium]
MAVKTDEKDVLVYKDKPLIRNGNIVYYGNITDKYIVMLQILSTVKSGDMEVADKVAVQLQYTDPDIKTRDRIVKKSEKNGFYEALDVGAIWLTRALAAK